jgi:hypothetical protein
VLIVYKNWFVGVTPGRSSASFQHIKSFVRTNTKVIITKTLLHVNVCKTCITMVPLLCCSRKCVLLYPSGTPNPETMYTILRYTKRLYGINRIVEVQNRIFGQGYTSPMHAYCSRTCSAMQLSNRASAGRSRARRQQKVMSLAKSVCILAELPNTRV